MAIFDQYSHFLVANFVHAEHLMEMVLSLFAARLFAVIRLNSDETLLQGYRTESGVKEEESLVWVDLEKFRHVVIIRQSGAEPHTSYDILVWFNLNGWKVTEI